MRALLTLIVGVLLFVTAAPGWAASDKRVALVIGNSGYQKFPQLPNPRNDAEDVTAALKRIGFTVIGGSDLTRQAMRDSLRQFARAAQDAEAAMVFYAGHGLQYRGRNYLVPIDAKLEDEFDLDYETVRVDDVVEELNRADGPRILILDACRNLPLKTKSKDAFSSAGLAKLSGRGLIVAYATQANQVAYDGTGRNSIFTGAFIKTVVEPGLDATQVFQRVSMNVDRATGGRQTPELSLSYPGQFYFNKGETEREAWPKARASGDPQALRDFIARFPDSFLVEDAKDLIRRFERRRAEGDQVASGGSGDADRGGRTQLARRPDDDPAAMAKIKEEAEKAAWERLQEEQKRRAEARQQAEQERIAQEAKDRQRQAQEAKQEEDRRRLEARRLELERQVEEARQKKLAEERAVAEAKERQRLAQEQKQEEERRRVEARRAEQERVAEEARQKKLADERTAAEARERQRLAQEQRQEEERRRVEARRAEQERLAEEARQSKLAEERAAAEARERQKLAETARQEDERRRAETRRAEAERVAEEARQRRVADAAAQDAQRNLAYQQSQAQEDRRPATELASGAGGLSREEQDRLAWQQLEEEQRRRAQGTAQVDRTASLAPGTQAPFGQAGSNPGSGDGSVDTTLSAIKPGLGTADRSPGGAMRLASNDAGQPVVTSVPPAGVFPKDTLDQDQLVRAVQGELARIGCYDDEPDGKWDRDSRDALRKFGRQAKLTPVPSEPNADLLEDLKRRPAQFCPIECGAGERLSGGQCVAVARPEPKPVIERPRPKPKPAVVQERRAPEPRPVAQAPRPKPAAAPPQAPVSTAAAPRPRAVMGVGF